ncbi:MAG: CoA-binding protein [Acidobacteriota bacterium]|nr:CoA-binding protein [Acidobacteriota bacterium]
MTPSLEDRIKSYMSAGPYAVVGASSDREKYGNKVLRAYQQHGLEVYPINPRATEIEGLKCYATLADLPVKVRGISVITPPAITEKVVEAAAAAGIRMVWMQPGAESPEAIRKAEALGLEVIAGGPCFLVLAHYRE